MNTWDILGIIAIILLIVFFIRGKNAVWGTFSIALLLGLIVRLIYWIASIDEGWLVFKKILIVAVFLGAAFEIFGRKKTV